jgi:dienelactone hydrolase
MKHIICAGLAALLLAAILPVVAGAADDWRADLDAALAMEPGTGRDELVGKVARAAPGWEDVGMHLKALEFGEPAGVQAVLDSTECIDGVTRPWVLYVSTHYDPSRPAPLFVRLHGGVGVPNIRSDPVGYASEDEFAPGVEERSWLVVYPMGQVGATWWDDVGMANIRNLVREVKRNYNVDDDRVYMGGFSDGGSGSFAHAMLRPTDYAAFLALNGHMGVASKDNNMPLYAPNMANTPVYATTTHDDDLYPTHKMAATIGMAQKAGADIIYKTFAGYHDFDDIASDLPFMFEFLERHRRDPFPPRIVWEAADKKFGRCRWFAIDEITTAEPERWHRDHNVALIDTRITFGFISDWEFEGEGVYVSRVIEESAAEAMGLLADDIIVRGEEMSIGNIDDLNAYKETLHRGGPFGLTVKRGEELVILRGNLPEPQNYLVFKRDRPSARADVTFIGNRVDIRASRVGALRVLVHPDMVNLAENLVITVNGKAVRDARVEPDLAFMIENFLENRDRKLLYVAEVKIDLESEKEVGR